MIDHIQSKCVGRKAQGLDIHIVAGMFVESPDEVFAAVLLRSSNVGGA